MDTKPIIGYWQIRGLAEPIRLLLVYLGVDFEDKHYVQGEAPDFDGSQWKNAIESLGMHFPNLPHLIDGDFKISETVAIIEYLALKYNPELLGETLREKGEVKQLGGVILDIKNYMSHSCYMPRFDELKSQVVGDVKFELGKVASYLGEKQFLNGAKVTWPDFFLLETLDMIEALAPGSLNEVSQILVNYRSRVASLPNIQEYISKPRLYWNNSQATWR